MEVIPKHNRGSYKNKLPKVTASESLQRSTTNKYINDHSRSRITKYSQQAREFEKSVQQSKGGKGGRQRSRSKDSNTSSNTNNNFFGDDFDDDYDNDNDNNNNSLRRRSRSQSSIAGAGNNKSKQNLSQPSQIRQWTKNKSDRHRSATKRRGSILAGLKQGRLGNNLSMAPDGEQGRWVRVYESKVAKIYEHHRCRMSKKMKLAKGGSYFDENKGPEDIDTDTTVREYNEIQNKIGAQHHVNTAFINSRFSAPANDSNQILHAETAHHSKIDFVPKFTEPQRWSSTLGRNKLCEECSEHCSVDGRTVYACKYCSTIWHVDCLYARDKSFLPPNNPNNYACDECKAEIRFSKKEYEQQVRKGCADEVLATANGDQRTVDDNERSSDYGCGLSLQLFTKAIIPSTPT